MSLKTTWFLRGALALLVVQLTACPEQPQPPPPPEDTSPPSTRANPLGGSFTSAQTVTLACDDGSGSGCDATYYTTDGSNPTTGSTRYSNPISLRSTTTLKFFSVDKAGNQESVRIETYTINLPPADTEAPTTTASPAGGTYTSAQTVTLTCNDGSGSGCANTYYTTDGSDPTTRSNRYTAPLSISATTTLKFFSVDQAGNQEQARTETYTLNIPPADTQAPTTTASPAGGSYNAAQSVTLACNDGSGSGCANTYFTTDGSNPTTSSTLYAAPIPLFVSTTLKFFSVDAAGNAESVRTEAYVIDTSAPTTTAAPAGGTYGTAQSVTLTCADSTGVGCANTYYTTDGTEPTTSSTRYTAPIAIAANTTLKLFSVDRVGNAEAVRTQTYVIDTQAPTTTASPAGGTYGEAQSVTLTCNDGSGSGCAATYYTTDGSTPTTSSPRYSSPLSIDGSATLKFFSVDSLGNTEPVRTETYVITAPDTRAPTTAASPAGGSYNTAQSVTLTCNDSVGGSGCANTYYTTDGSEPTTSSTRYTAPIAIATNTTLKFFSVDSAGNQEQVRTASYVIDSQAPTTTASPAGGAYNTAQSVTLTCGDGSGTGCANTYYTTDGSNPTTGSTRYTAPIAIAASTTLKFFSVDSVGNQEQVRTASYVIDSQAPTTAASPAGGNYSVIQTVTLTCNDGSGSGCAATYYTVDGSTPTTSSTRYSAPIDIEGTITLKFFSVDLAGNSEPIRTESYVITAPDIRAPTTTASPAGGTYNAAQSITLSCGDGAGGSGCASTYYTTDGSDPTTGSLPYTSPIPLFVTTTLKFFSVDRAGNQEPIRSQLYIIDTTAPTTTATPAGGNYNAAQTVTLACNDGTGTGCTATYYTTDGSNPTTGSTRYTAPLTIATSTTLKFFSVDSAGNAEAVRTESYVIDTVAPTTTATPAGGTFNTSLSITLTCNDGSGTGCGNTYYTTDGSNPTTGSQVYTGPLPLFLSTTLKFFSVDNAGNQEPIRTQNYIIDTAAPTTTAAPASGTYNSAQAVTLTCGDGTGTGCTATYYTTDGSNPTTGSPRYTAPIAIAANTTLKFFSVDGAGNAETIRAETYVIDTQAPTTTAIPAGGTYNTAQTVILACGDGTGTGCAATYYTTDGTEPTTGSPRYTLPLNIAASTTLKFFSVDNIGNQEATRTQSYIIDTAAPTTTAAPASGTYNSAQAVTLTCGDGSGTGCTATYYTTNGSNPTTGSTRYTAPIAIAANTTLKFFSVDGAGNAEAIRTETYVIDTVAPTTTATPAGGTYNSAQTVTLTCGDGTGAGCAATYYTTDGSNPTSGSPRYTAPIAIATTTTLKFFSVDNAGNQEAFRTANYIIDTQAPVTTPSPAGGTYTSTQTVTLTCNDGTGSGCAATYYTTNGSDPTTGSPRYTSPIAIAADTTLKFFSVDNAGNAESIDIESYTIITPTSASTQIAAVRAAANGAINLPVNGAFVTYLKPAVGNDPAGFFLQAEQAGPAIFVAIDPNTLAPVPAVGDRVLLRATQKATQDSQARITAIGSYARFSQGTSIEPLRADVSNVDFSQAASLNDRESELITITGRASTAFTAAGAGHVQSTLTTTGTATGTNLRLRLPIPLQDQLDLAQNCNVTIRAPLWRFTTTAQPSAWGAGDVSSISCPGPRVALALPTDPTTLVVRFDRRIDPALVLANGSQFTFTNGLVATGAVVVDREVILTTSAQVSGTSYQVTVANTVRDTYGTPVEATGNTATFTGYRTPATLLINEVAPNVANSRDLVELLAVQGGSVNAFTLTQEDNPSLTLATLPDVVVATGDIIVIHLNPAAANGDAPASETTGKAQYPAATYSANYDSAWDFQGSGTNAISYTHRVLRLNDLLGNTQDGVAFARPGLTSPPTLFPGTLQALQADSHWLPLNCGGVDCTYTSTPTAVDVSANWNGVSTSRATTVFRTSLTDTNAAGDWTVGASTLGASNIPDTTAPTTTASPAGGIYASAQSVTLSCNDGLGSGCAATYYTTDGSNPTTGSPRYTAPLNIATTTTLKFFSVDNAGNQEAVRTQNYVIDTQAPTTTASPAGGTYASAQSVVLSCNDGLGSGCAATYYTTDGSDPTTGSTPYTAPITIAVTTTLKFFSVDNLGNQETIRTQGYVITTDTQAPTTTASPAGGTYTSTQSVTLSCNDGTGSGCAATYYTTDGSNPTTGSPRYTAPITLAATATLKFFSVDNVGNTEAIRTEVYTIDSSPSSQIAAVRTAANGTVNLPVNGALVTYVRPLIGNDPAGFFLQADRAGPAIFVAVDPATLTPTPTVGDAVSLTATTKATQDGQARITALTGYTRLSQGGAVEGLRVDASNVDFSQVTEISNYESRLIYISGTLTTGFTAAGTGFEQATLATLGTPAGTNLRLRVNSILRDQFDLANGCALDVFSPMWRFNNTAQPSILVPTDLGAVLCPAPRVTGALATTSTTITVRFDRRIDPASVLTDGSQFTFTGGLVATAATVVDREVRLTTNAQTAGTTYQVTADWSVSDTYGTPVDATANTASFTGFNSGAMLRITEANPNITNSRDVVELMALQGGPVNGFTLVQEDGTGPTVLATLPNAVVAAGDVIVIHLNPTLGSGGYAPGSETTSKTQYPRASNANNYDTAWDFYGGTTGLSFSHRVVRIRDAASNTQDAVAFALPNLTGQPPSAFPSHLQALQSQGLWLPANCGGALCTYTSAPTAVQVSASWQVSTSDRTTSIRRTSATDTNSASDWAVGASSFGLPNP